MNQELTYITNVDDLKIGDVVDVPSYPACGWHKNYKYPLARKGTVTKITPKKTKITVTFGKDRYTEIKAKDGKIFDDLCLYDEAAIDLDSKARVFLATRNMRDGIYNSRSEHGSLYFNIAELDDDDLQKAYDFYSWAYNKFVKPHKENKT